MLLSLNIPDSLYDAHLYILFKVRVVELVLKAPPKFIELVLYSKLINFLIISIS